MDGPKAALSSLKLGIMKLTFDTKLEFVKNNSNLLSNSEIGNVLIKVSHFETPHFHTRVYK